MVAPNLNRAHLIQGTRIMRFQEVYEGWRERRLSQSEAAEILGVCERSFRRYSARFDASDGDLNSLADKRLSQILCLGRVGELSRFCIKSRENGYSHCGTRSHGVALKKFAAVVDCYYPPRGVCSRLTLCAHEAMHPIQPGPPSPEGSIKERSAQ